MALLYSITMLLCSLLSAECYSGSEYGRSKTGSICYLVNIVCVRVSVNATTGSAFLVYNSSFPTFLRFLHQPMCLERLANDSTQVLDAVKGAQEAL